MEGLFTFSTFKTITTRNADRFNSGVMEKYFFTGIGIAQGGKIKRLTRKRRLIVLDDSRKISRPIVIPFAYRSYSTQVHR